MNLYVCNLEVWQEVCGLDFIYNTGDGCVFLEGIFSVLFVLPTGSGNPYLVALGV